LDRGLAAREPDDVGAVLGRDEEVEEILDLLERQADAGVRVGEAERAVLFAARVDRDDPEAGVLLVVGTEAAVARAAYRSRTPDLL
jgi:hypothetical protein